MIFLIIYTLTGLPIPIIIFQLTIPRTQEVHIIIILFQNIITLIHLQIQSLLLIVLTISIRIVYLLPTNFLIIIYMYISSQLVTQHLILPSSLTRQMILLTFFRPWCSMMQIHWSK